MPPCTEIAIIFLKNDATIEDASSPAGQQFAKCLDVLRAQPGLQRQYYGRQLEDPRLLVWVNDWDDISDHHNFMKADSYEELFKTAAPILDFEHPPYLFHANFASHPPNEPREAPITEFATFALPTDASEEQKSALEDALLNLAQTTKTEGSCTSFATGWIIEELDHEQATNGKAIGFSALLGWPSKEAHIETSQGKEFQAAVGPVKGMMLPPTSGYNGMSVYHVKLREG